MSDRILRHSHHRQFLPVLLCVSLFLRSPPSIGKECNGGPCSVMSGKLCYGRDEADQLKIGAWGARSEIMSRTYPSLSGKNAKCCICNATTDLYWGIIHILCTNNERDDQVLDHWNACGVPCNRNCIKIRAEARRCVRCRNKNVEQLEWKARNRYECRGGCDGNPAGV